MSSLLQIDRLVNRAFKNLKADEVLNFSVAVTVMRVQRKWRARMRAAKLKRKREVGLDGLANWLTGCAILCMSQLFCIFTRPTRCCDSANWWPESLQNCKHGYVATAHGGHCRFLFQERAEGLIDAQYVAIPPQRTKLLGVC